MTDENILKEKATKYLLCFNDNCPRHVHCLHWQVALYVSEELPIVTFVNPRFKQVVTNECSYYRDDTPQRVAKGMIHFYDTIPRKLETAIKADFITRFTRVGYYKMRNGLRPITTDIEEIITNVCRSHGWKEELKFDEQGGQVIW